ncbi:MAG TPA: hypothetical protein VNA24_14200 [Hyalangium sp.]|nr:hypothetical protein [Hyalangium sp.]
MPSPLEEQIAERIQDFDVPALLELLSQLGYGEKEIEFRSHRSAAHQGQLLQSIEFIEEPARRVIITANLGLLTVQTPLPSFFFQQMDRLDQDMMEAFIGFFDDLLLRERFRGLFPERDPSVLPRWEEEESLVNRLTLLRLASPSSLHWLFSKVYPEAEVLVRRDPRRQRMEAPNLLLGFTLLGEGPPMGGFSNVPMGGMEAWIYLDEAATGSGAPWATEAQRRFNQDILPRLAEVNLSLTVYLVIRELHGYARLHPRSYVGFDPIKRQRPLPEEPPKVIILFSGLTSESDPDPDPTRPVEKLTAA